MELRDDFIGGIFDYCDRWCERCAFTGRCRLFADKCGIAFEQDRRPPIERDRAGASPGAANSKLEGAAREIHFAASEFRLPAVAREHRGIEERGRDYGHAAYKRIELLAHPADPATAAAIEVIRHYSFLAGAKIHRALLAPFDADGPQSDANGSAKVALLLIARLEEAWKTLQAGALGRSAETFIDDLAWLAAEVRRVRPRAQRFVRPGFDEPEAARALEAPGGKRDQRANVSEPRAELITREAPSSLAVLSPASTD
jgi:hypothetical protein